MPKVKKEKYDMSLMVKNKETDWIGHLFRHITIPISKFLIRHTNITPNQISIFEIFVLLAGIILLTVSGFSSSPYAYRLVGSILIFFVSILDHFDGKIARVKKITSLIGKWLDEMIGYVSLPLIFLATAIGLNNPTWLLWGSVAAICFPLQFLVIYVFKYDFDPTLAKKNITLINKKNKLRFIYGTSTLFVLLPITAMFNHAEWTLAFFATFGNLFWMAILVLQLKTVLAYEKSKKNKQSSSVSRNSERLES